MCANGCRRRRRPASSTYDAATGQFTLSPEQAAVFADDGQPRQHDRRLLSRSPPCSPTSRSSTEAFKTGKGVGWGERCNCLFCGVERFFRPGYKAHLLAEWLPALDGVVAKLERGAKVADVGCGHGASTMIMAKAFPNSEFVGIDFHDARSPRAKEHANGLRNVRFETARARTITGTGFDLVTMFDALHDMGDPVGAATHVAQDAEARRHADAGRAEGRRQPRRQPQPGRPRLLRLLDQRVRAGLAQPGGRRGARRAGRREADLAEVVRQGGFSRFRRATETPFNMVLEARA